MKKFLVVLFSLTMAFSCVSVAFAASNDASTTQVTYREEDQMTERTGSWCVLGNDTKITNFGVTLKKGTTVFRQDTGVILMNGNISVKTDGYWTTYRFTNGSYVEIGTTKISKNPSKDFGPGVNVYIQNGWIELENGKWKYRENGRWLKNEWLNGQYYFDASGYMVTGKRTIGNSCYYFGTGNDGYGEGAMVSNAIVKVNGSRYYFGKDGVMLKNTTLVNDKDGKIYTINSSGTITETTVTHSSF